MFFDHVLANFPDGVSQSGVTDIDISDHHLIYCTKKLRELKATAINKLLSVLLEIIHFKFIKRLWENYFFPAMNYLMTLTKLMKTSFKRSWQLFTILHPVKTNALRVHHKYDLMLKSWKK